MADKYKIVGIFYTKPKTVWDAKGEVLLGRQGITIMIGMADDFGGNPRKVENIVHDSDTNTFFVYYHKGGLKVLPYLADTEVMYEIDIQKK